MKIRLKVLIPVCFVVLLFSLRLIAGTTGKIAGVITDAETREALPGVNVVVQNTYLGAATDLDGQFIILNIPPGIYTLQIDMMGYRSVVIENVRVRNDLTTTVDQEMVQTVLEAGETVTIVAERPLVQLDMTSSMATVGSEEIDNLPVQTINDILELEAGVVRSGGIHIRGGRAGEVAYWVDGVATTDVFSGGMGMQVENAAVAELQVISGTFNAEYGQAMSGIVNIVTKEGARSYSGEIKAWVGDYVSGDDTYSVLKEVHESTDPLSGKPRSVGVTENPLKDFNPNYNVEGTLSGPVPFTMSKLTFFFNGRYVTDEGYLYGREWFQPHGLPGDSSLVPMNPYDRVSSQAKFTYSLNPNVKISYNGFWSQTHQDRVYRHDYKYNPGGVPEQTSMSNTHIFSLNHVLSPKTFYDLKVNRFYTEYESFVYEDPEVHPRFLVRVLADTSLDIDEYVFDPNTAEGAAELDRIRSEGLIYRYITNPIGPIGYVHPDSSRQPVGYSFVRAGQDLSHYSRSTAYLVGKFDLTSQVTKTHQIKTGAEVRLYELTLDSYTLQKKLQEGKTEEVIPFEPWVPPISNINRDKYNRKPREISGYIQDKIELKDIILNLGMRYDYFDANSIVLTDPKDPNIYDPMLDSNRYKNPEAPEDERIEYTPDERRAFMHKKVDPKMKVSPRLGIAYPITDRGVIHFSYGHFFQIPEFRYLYDSPDFKFSKGGTLEIVGNADLKPQKTVMYEIGLQQQLTSDIGIDLTLFYRDVRDWVSTGHQINTYNQAISYTLYENKDYSNVRGITLKFEKRYSHNFFANVDYSFQIAEGTYSDPTDAFNAEQNQEEPRLSILPLNWDQNHTLNASFSYSANNWIVSLIGRYWTGRPYTPSFPRGATIGTTTYSGLRENSARLPHVKGVDLYVNRRFDLKAFRLHLFVNVYNVFDIRDETAVYGDTGTAEYTTLIDPKIIDYDVRRIGTVEEYVKQPGWYTSPRQIQLGASIEF